MMGQAAALLILKLRLMRTSSSASQLLSTALLSLVLVLGLLLSLALSAGVFYGITGMQRAIDPVVLLIALDGVLGVFLFMWTFGLVVELQRSDTLDFRKMMYLPVSLRMIYFLNFLVSLVTPTTILFAPPLLALVLALSLRLGAPLLLGVPLVVMFFLMVGAWAYYVRGLLAIVMQNKRRRRMILTLLPVFFVVLAQLPNLFLNLSQGRFEDQDFSNAEVASIMVALNIYIPFGWLPYGIYALVHENDLRDAAVCLAGLGALTLAGLSMGYRSTRRFYANGNNDGSARPKNNGADRSRTVATLRRLPGLDTEASALTATAFLSFVRHPNIRMQVIMPLILGGVMLVIFSQSQSFERLGGDRAGLSWLPVAVLIWPFMNFSHVFFNQFGIDREAFRGMVLLPTSRHKLLLAKNLALFPFVVPVGLVYLLAAAGIFGTTPANFILAVVLILQLYFAFCVLGNFSSLYLPYRIDPDMMRRPGNRGTMFLMGLISAVFVGILMVPVSLCFLADGLASGYGWWTAWPLGLIAGLVLFTLTFAIWRLTLTAAGDLLLAREQRILATLIKDRD